MRTARSAALALSLAAFAPVGAGGGPEVDRDISSPAPPFAQGSGSGARGAAGAPATPTRDDAKACAPPENPVRPPLPEVGGGAVTAWASDRRGGWFLAGSFNEVLGVPVRGLAHVLATGAVDARFRHGVDLWCGPQLRGATARCLPAAIRAMTTTGAALYVAGDFVAIAGSPRRYLAAFDLASGDLLPWRATPGPSDEDNRQLWSCTLGEDFGYRSIATDGERIYAAHCDLVALDAKTGEPASGFDPPRLGVEGEDEVSNLVIESLHGDSLTLRGHFDRAADPTGASFLPTPCHVVAIDRRSGRVRPAR